MQAFFKWCNALYWLALMVWVGALLSAGAAAAGVFSTLPRLGLIIETYRPALGSDSAEHGRLAGGMVMEPIFAATEIVQIAAAAIVFVMMLLQLLVFRMRWQSFANILRSLCIVVAIGLVAHHFLVVAPRMNRELRQFWQAAESNEATAMTTHRAAFETDHIVANRMFMFRLALLTLAVVASAAAFTPPPSSVATLQQPDLFRKRA